MSIRPTSEAANGEFTGAIGSCIVSAEALAAGVASIPEPFTDADWGGWFMWRPFAYRYEFQSAIGTNYGNWTFEIDSKAMRKISPNEAVVTVVESFAGAFDVNNPLRTLIKLS